MADISQEVQKFRDAVKGEEVRGSMISLAIKVNADGENALAQVAQQVTRIDGIAADATQTLNNANAAIQEANTAIDTANATIIEAQNTLAEGVQQVQQAAGSANLAESWAIGNKGIRPGENSNNSKYFSEQSKADADRAKQEADRAAQYSAVVAPTFHIDWDTMELVQDTQGTGIVFTLDENKVLSFEFVN
ncbi:hypothetical protein [Lacrimispora saccharolytica]|uniref:Uncharacterized protein n=1 Tax=Lacrimispora saccharolytica (strain ATCC 35040 / DSM 2544 / NRCC 2533 / WM1) TaxID=610130 RepID=D9R5H7_LACSW|nr:hypothetical protein [Lacrimispora saccharolytica]ADL03383.1 hypothetical protein Closa_0758 [[Clostridium] saccharolyticum WM1]QRV18461.1 hypothetical protein I6K70_12985 [Lacrimispora saccharolytica]